MSKGLRVMWIAVAPIITIGCVIAFPLVAVVFQRGQFTPDDTNAVAMFIQMYLFSLVGSCLATITGKSFYVLKDTRTLALFGTAEAICYAIYTVLLTKWLGVVGIVLGYVLYFDISFTWQVLIIRHRTGPFGGTPFVRSFFGTSAAAIVGGLASLTVIALSSNQYAQLFAGGITGLIAYFVVLWLIKSDEYVMIRGVVLSPFRKSSM